MPDLYYLFKIKLKSLLLEVLGIYGINKNKYLLFQEIIFSKIYKHNNFICFNTGAHRNIQHCFEISNSFNKLYICYECNLGFGKHFK